MREALVIYSMEGQTAASASVTRYPKELPTFIVTMDLGFVGGVARQGRLRSGTT